LDILQIPKDIVAIPADLPGLLSERRACVSPRTLLQDKMLFGSDWPMLTVERWQKEFAEYNFPDNVVRKIMLENAKRVLRLEQ